MSSETTGRAGPGRDEAPAVFVVSTGRCGSTLLSNMLRQHPDILSLSEFFGMLLTGPFPDGKLTGAQYWALLSTPHPFVTMAYRAGAPIEEFLYQPGRDGRFTPGTGIPPILVTPLPHLTSEPERLYDEIAVFTQNLEPADAGTQHRHLFGWLRQRMGAQLWVERSGFSLRHLPDLISQFPGARFVHLYRDGRECAYSMSRSGAFRLGTVWMRLLEALGVNPYLEEVPASATVPAALRPLMPGTFTLEAFEAIELPVEDFGRAWSEQIMAGLDTLDQLPPGRVLSVSYEYVVADPRGALARIGQFAGVTPYPAWLERASGLVRSRTPRWLSLPERDREKLTLACDQAMTRLYPGYARTGLTPAPGAAGN
ncbi:MAG TPA: sulfotransferase [Streptosporangiaceae bacterium]|nr:sulfotransferase [Streptosporangiaceae bacterium]